MHMLKNLSNCLPKNTHYRHSHVCPSKIHAISARIASPWVFTPANQETHQISNDQWERSPLVTMATPPAGKHQADVERFITYLNLFPHRMIIIFILFFYKRVYIKKIRIQSKTHESAKKFVKKKKIIGILAKRGSLCPPCSCGDAANYW